MKITLEIKEDELLTMAEVGLSKITGKHKVQSQILVFFSSVVQSIYNMQGLGCDISTSAAQEIEKAITRISSKLDDIQAAVGTTAQE